MMRDRAYLRGAISGGIVDADSAACSAWKHAAMLKAPLIFSENDVDMTIKVSAKRIVVLESRCV